MNFITGEKFIELADFVFAPNRKWDCNKIINTFCLSKLFDKAIVYTHTMYVKELFELLDKVPNINVTLISHNCDENVNETYKVPKNVIVWYTTNCDVDNDKIKSIPIGLENSQWFTEIHKKNKMVLKLTEPKKFKNLVYVNFNIDTNKKERQECFDYFKTQCSCWVTIDNKKNGIDFDNYLDNIYNHKFVVCPDGNGIDTHRLWETLYMNSIPIVKRNINTIFYEDLPICFIHNWDEVTEEFLVRSYIKIKTEKWNLQKLDFNYWKQLIKNI